MSRHGLLCLSRSEMKVSKVHLREFLWRYWESEGKLSRQWPGRGSSILDFCLFRIPSVSPAVVTAHLLRPAWFTEQVLGQPRKQKETLSQNKIIRIPSVPTVRSFVSLPSPSSSFSLPTSPYPFPLKQVFLL